MPANEPMVDRDALRRARHRARPQAGLFLHDEVCAEFEERLQDINRSFTAPAIVTGFPDHWQRRFPGARIVTDEEVLDLREAAHDLVIHAMALHWADDPLGQMIQCRRALSPDGLFLAGFLGGETLVELRTALSRAEIETRGGLSPRVAPMAEIRDMGALLQRSGFALPVADGLRKTARYRDLAHLARDLRDMGETNALADRDRTIAPGLFRRAAGIYRDAHADASGRIAATFDLIFLTGWAPAPSQPQPLRPGSARHSLADALGAAEFDAGVAPALEEPPERDGQR